MFIKKYTQMVGIIIISTMLVLSCKKETPTPEKKIPFNQINGFIINNQGTKILATDMGLFYLNELAKDYKQVESDVTLAPINDIKYLISGTSNLMWLSSTKGALELNSQEHITTANSELANNNIGQINIDNKLALYMSTPDGISIRDNQNWYLYKGLNDLYKDFQVTDMATASNGYTYVTTNGGGIERFTLDVDGISGATIFDSDWTLLESDSVWTVFIDDTVQAYGTNYGAALHYSKYTKWDWETFTTSDGLVNDTVLSIIKDKAGDWWFGTMGGLSKLHETEWTSYTVKTHNIVSDTIKYLALDTDGSIWFASNKGLSHFSNNIWINY